METLCTFLVGDTLWDEDNAANNTVTFVVNFEDGGEDGGEAFLLTVPKKKADKLTLGSKLQLIIED